MYGQKTWSTLWLLSVPIDLTFIILFTVSMVRSILYWVKKKAKHAYLPFLINIVFLILIVTLPLNWIRNRIEFYFYKNNYEQAVKLAKSAVSNSTDTLYKLPDNLQYLSTGGGDIVIKNNKKGSSVLFFTFRGVPDGMSGFVKLSGTSKSIQDFYDGPSVSIKKLGNDWYFVHESD